VFHGLDFFTYKTLKISTALQITSEDTLLFSNQETKAEMLEEWEVDAAFQADKIVIETVRECFHEVTHVRYPQNSYDLYHWSITAGFMQQLLMITFWNVLNNLKE
jgi:hypothetical protein